jgi:hypothetical protein
MVEEIATFLAVTGHGTVGTDIFRRQMPNDPDDILCIVQEGGEAGEFVQDSLNIEVEQPRLQIYSRSLSPATAELALDGPYRELMRVRNQMIGGTRYISIMPMMSPAIVDRDENSRFIARCDFSVRKGLSDAT